MKLLIIGNSAAAIGCVEGINATKDATPGGAECSITLVASEPHHTYSRPLISYLLYGKTDEERMLYRPRDFYEKNGVNALLGKTVVSVDANAHCATLDDGEAISYDKLLVATGSRPFVPPMKGLDTVEKKTTFMTLDEAHKLRGMIDGNSRVLIVGAGLIGLKCAEGIAHMVKSIDVVDLAERILPSVLDEQASAVVRDHIEKQNVRFHLKTAVDEFDGDRAALKNGEVIEFDALVLAVGVRPNTELLKQAGAVVNRGIVVDGVGRTSLADVYAAGDCTECTDLTTGTNKIIAVLPNAYMQGESAGLHMMGVEKPFTKAIPMNAGGFFGLHIITAGSYEGTDWREVKDGSYKRLVTRDGYLVGYIMVGDVRRAGIYTSMIRDKIPLDTVDFELLKEKPQLMAFKKRDREKMLGGAR